MLIHLKRNEKLYINGAVIRLDRRGSVELLNDAQFLLENHIMQAEAATTPLRQLYFIVQMMLMDPENANLTACLFQSHVDGLKALTSSADYGDLVGEVCDRVEKGNYFDCLKSLRRGFALDDRLLGPGQKTSHQHEEAA
jgi:flagellar biosynthesis repressor protein FlbT